MPRRDYRFEADGIAAAPEKWNCAIPENRNYGNSRNAELTQCHGGAKGRMPTGGTGPGGEHRRVRAQGRPRDSGRGSSGLQPPDRGRSTHPPRTGRMEIAASTGGHGGARPDPCDNGSHLTRQGHRQRLTATIAVPAGWCPLL